MTVVVQSIYIVFAMFDLFECVCCSTIVDCYQSLISVDTVTHTPLLVCTIVACQNDAKMQPDAVEQ